MFVTTTELGLQEFDWTGAKLKGAGKKALK